MKKLNYLLGFFVFAFVIVSCEPDDSLNPRAELVTAPYVFFEEEFAVIDAADIDNSYFGGTLMAPANNVASYHLQVRKVGGSTASNWVDIYTATSFPASFQITAAMISNALNVTPAAGDKYEFNGYSVGTDGSVVDFKTLAPDIAAESGQKQAYQLVTYVACPFVIDDAVGTYTVNRPATTDTPFETSATDTYTFEVVAGDADGEIILKNPFGYSSTYAAPYAHPNYDPGFLNGTDIKVTVDPLGFAEWEPQMSYHIGLSEGGWVADGGLSSYGPLTSDGDLEGSGFVFSCVGSIDFAALDGAFVYGGACCYGWTSFPWSFSATKN
ncbi:MAG: hypothetical protein ACPGCZ_02410 [Flavobacteriaceae bacterium]